MPYYPRDLHGYGASPPNPRWPGGAKIAIQFVVNYEEGGENNILHGDNASEAFLSEIVGAVAWHGQRHWNMESIYEYGARAGFWRLHRLFSNYQIPVTVFGVATALARSPAQVCAMQEANWEIASHGLKWIEYKDFSEDEERAQILEAMRLHSEVTGAFPAGWYTGRSSMNTVRLVSEQKKIEYIADSYSDDLPYWTDIDGRAQLIVPYTLDTNDMRFATAQGFNTGQDFFGYLKDSFDSLYLEGEAGFAKMMSIGLHCRLVGRPGRIQGLRRFIEYACSHDDVWFARRIDIAQHWKITFPPSPESQALGMDRKTFVERFGGVFEKAPWIADRAFNLERSIAHETLEGVCSLLLRTFRSLSDGDRQIVLKNYDEQGKRFPGLEEAARKYLEKFGFPFVVANKDLSEEQAAKILRERLLNEPPAEFDLSCRQVELIAEARLKDIFKS